MIGRRRKPSAEAAPAPGYEESWSDSALFGATITIFLVALMILGVGYLGYASIEHPQHASAHPAHVVQAVRAR